MIKYKKIHYISKGNFVMDNILFTVYADELTKETQTTESTVVAEQNTNNSNEIIDIGGIIVTLIVGILTCFITWKQTMKTIKQLKLSYSVSIYPILANSITNKQNIADLEITYKKETLKNPCLLTIDIVNSGNSSVTSPPIKIKSNENLIIIPGYFDDIPSGYEQLWKMNMESSNCCALHLDHINPKQVVKARFFLNDRPKEKLIFECPMADIQTQEITYDVANEKSSRSKGKLYDKANYILIAITFLLYITTPTWSMYIDELIWLTRLRLPSSLTAMFILAVPTVSIIFNLCGIKWIDSYIHRHKHQLWWIKLTLLFVSILLLVFIIFDILIRNFNYQVIVGIISLILLSLFIHISMLSK